MSLLREKSGIITHIIKYHRLCTKPNQLCAYFSFYPGTGIFSGKPVDLAVNEYIEGAFKIVEPTECSGKQDLECMEETNAMEENTSADAEEFPFGHVTL